MPISDKYRKIYLERFTEKEIELPCSICDGGVLKIDKENFILKTTKAGEFLMDKIGIEEIDSDIYRFVAILICKSCGDIATMSGVSKPVSYHGDCNIEECKENEDSYECVSNGLCDHIHIHSEINYIYPTIKILNLSKEVPEDIRDVLEKSFSLYWIDSGSSGNKIRVALEIFMDHLNIPRQNTNKKSFISLDERIKKFGEIEEGKYKKLSELILSVKWLGNDATHFGSLSKKDILDAYEILEHVFDEFFFKEKRDYLIQEKADNLISKYKK